MVVITSAFLLAEVEYNVLDSLNQPFSKLLSVKHVFSQILLILHILRYHDLSWLIDKGSNHASSIDFTHGQRSLVLVLLTLQHHAFTLTMKNCCFSM